MKQINVKLLAILFLSSLTILVGAFFLYKFQKSRNADGLLTRAAAQFEEGEYGRAAGFLRRYLAIRPDDDEQFAQLAIAMQKHVQELAGKRELDMRTLQGAYGITEEAVRKNPDNQELRRQAVDFSIQFQRYQDAISHINVLIENGDTDPDLQVKLALCYTRSGQESEIAVPALSEMIGFDRADRSFSAEKATAPDNLDAYSLLANIYYVKLRDLDSALPIIDRLVIANPDEYKAHLMRAGFYQGLGSARYMNVISEETRKALELAPDREDTLLAAASLAMVEKDHDRAKQLYEECLEKHPGNARAYQGLSTWSLQQRDTESALKYLNEGIKANEGSPAVANLLWDRASVEIDTNQLDAAAATREELKGLNYQKPFIDFLDGRIEFAKKEWLKASQKMAKARGFIAQLRPRWLPPLDSSLAVCYEKMGQHDLRLKAMRRVSESDPLNTVARWGVMEAHLAMGQMEKAVAEYTIIEDQIEGSPLASNPKLLSARLQMELLQQSLEPESLQSFTEAKQLVEEIQSSGLLREPAISQLVAKYYTATGQDKKAQAVTDLLRTTRPNDPSVLMRNIQKIAATKGLEAALTALDANSRRLGDPIGVRLLRCELLARLRPEEAKEELRILEADLASLSPKQRIGVTRGIGRIYLQMNELEDTRRIWAKLAKDRPNDIQVRMAMFELAMQTADEEGIQQSLDEIEQLVGRESAEWEWAEAVRIVWNVRNGQMDKSQLEDALGLVNQAVGRREGWDALYRLLGDIHLLRGEPLAAIEHLEKSLQFSVGHPSVYRSLTQLYFDQGRYDDAERMLKQLPPQLLTTTERRIQLDILSRRNQLPEDLEYNRDSQDPADHLWIANLLNNAGRYEEAEAAYLKAVELAPTNSAYWTSLMRMYAKTERLDEARDVIRQAELKLSERDAPAFLGQAHAILEDWSASAEHFKSAIQQNPEDDRLKRALAEVYIQAQQVEDAHVLIDGILEGSTPHDPNASDTIRWARQTKAKILASDGAYHAFAEALRLIEQNAPEDDIMSTSDLILWTRLSATRPDGYSREQAIEKLEEAQEKRGLVDGERRVLADLYQLQDRWVECKSVMLGLLAENPDDMQLLDPWLSWLIERQEVKDVAVWLAKCPPGSLVELRTRAHLDAMRGNSEKAVERLAKIIPPDLDPKDVGRLRIVAEIVEQLGEYDRRMYGAAEKVLRRYIKAKPQESLALAAYLGRRGGAQQVPEGLRLCGEHLNDGKQVAALQLANAILRRNRGIDGFDKYIDVVRGWYEKVQESQTDNLTVMIQRSEFEDIAGNSEQAENWLRTYMDRDEISNRQRSIVANNLAYLLSLRGETQESYDLVQSAMKFLGPTADLRDTLGMVFLARNRPEDAKREFEAAIGDGGVNGFKYVHLAMADLALGDAEKSAEAVRKAVARDFSRDQLNRLERDSFDELANDLKAKGVITDADLTPPVE